MDIIFCVIIRFTCLWRETLTETPSQKSSRVPSPVGTQKYDDMEGQFVANTAAGKLSFCLTEQLLVYFCNHFLLQVSFGHTTSNCYLVLKIV